MTQRRIFLASLPLLLSACAVTKSAPDGTTLKPNQGVLALRLSSNKTGRFTFVPREESTFAKRWFEDLTGGKETLVYREDQDQFLVIPVDAGEYMWSKIEMGNQFAWLRESNRFQVKAGQLTYIGNVRVFFNDNKFGIRVTDRSDEMREHLRANFPSYSSALAFEKALAEFNIR